MEESPGEQLVEWLIWLYLLIRMLTGKCWKDRRFTKWLIKSWTNEFGRPWFYKISTFEVLSKIFMKQSVSLCYHHIGHLDTIYLAGVTGPLTMLSILLKRWNRQKYHLKFNGLTLIIWKIIKVRLQFNSRFILEIYLDFTVDSVNWASMKNLSDMLHENDQRFVLILDPAIPSEAGPDYKPVRDHWPL